MKGIDSDLQRLNLKLGREAGNDRLDPVPRELGRPKGLGVEIPMLGYDLWNAHEAGYLSPGGKPVVFQMQIQYDASSPRMVESKSLKLFLNARSEKVYPSREDFAEEVRSSLAATVGAPVRLVFFERASAPLAEPLPGLSLDDLEPAAILGGPSDSPPLARPLGKVRAFRFHTHLFRSNCPVTGQPDWGAVLIEGRASRALIPEILLAYLLSYRGHRAFHEACCERIYLDLFQALQPERLGVFCFFTRRGGLDINPYRGNFVSEIRRALAWRQ